MRSVWTTSAAGAGVGLCLGVFQVVRENNAAWMAEHATPATIIVQTAAGAMLGGVFVGALMLYWSMRRHPAAARPRSGGLRPGGSTLPGHPARPRQPIKYGVRHVLILLFATALIGAGAFVLSACLAHPSVYGLLRGGFGAVFMIGLGGFLIWDDFIAPQLVKLNAGKG
jgi:hypothetical protein